MKKNMQIRLLMITLTLIFAVIICGAVSAADIYVNDTGDDGSGDGSIDNPYKTINWGITNANADDTINLNAGTFSTYTDSNHKDYNITIDKSLNIKGAGQNLTVINATGLGRIFTIQSGCIVTISDLTMTEGKAPNGTTGTSISAGTDGGNGGAIINSGTLIINNCSITNSRAGNGGNGWTGTNILRYGTNGGNGGNGGAIYNTGSLTINDSIFTGNRAGNGGNGGNAPSTFSIGGNGGDGGIGGAIYNEEVLLDGVECTVSITRSTISGNYAGNGGNGGNGSTRGSGGDGGDGGAIYIGGNILDWSHLTLTRSTLKDNVAGTRGLRGSGSSGGSNGSNGSVGGIYVNVYADATVQYNYLLNNGQYDIRKHGTDSVDARYNWWGSNYQGSSPSSRVSGNVNYSPWTTVSISANPGTIYNGEQSTVTAQFSYDVPDGIPVTFSFQGPPLGTLDTNPAYTNNGQATTTFTANTVGTSHVMATVDSQIVGPADIQINPMADLSISKSVDNVSHPGQTINYQDNINYTITVNNTGLDPAENVVIKDTISSLLNFNPTSVTSNVAFTYDWDSVNRIFTAYLTNPLNAGATAYLYLPAQVLAHNQTINNIANVTTTTYDPTTPDETSLSFDVPPAANVDLQKEFRQTRTGSAITEADYRSTVWAVITAHNNGPDAATVTITDTPSGFTPTPTANVNYYVSFDNGAHWTRYDASYNTTTGVWTINIPSGATYLLAIQGRVDQTGTVTNTAEQTAQDIYHSEPFETATATLSVDPAANINLTSLFRANYNNSPITTANYHDWVWAFIRAYNAGPNDAHVTINDLPSGFTPSSTYMVSYDNGAHWFSADGTFNGTDWTTTIPAGARYLLSIYGQVTGTGIVNHTATQTYQDIYNWGPFESRTATLDVPAAATIDVEKWFGEYNGPWAINSANYNDYISMIISATNTGPNATNAVIQDIAHGITPTTYAFGENYYVSFDGGNLWYPDDSYPGLWDGTNWYINNIPAGANWLLAIFGIVSATDTSSNGPVNNTATVISQSVYDPNNPTADPEGYDSHTANLQVDPAADLSVSKDVDDNTPSIGQLIMYTIRVHNNLFSPNNATGVTVTDNLPEGVTFDHASSPDYDPDTDTWTVGDLIRGDERILYIWVTVNANPTNPSYTNIAYVSGDQYDWDLTNNQDSETIYMPQADISISKEFRDTNGDVITTAHYNDRIVTIIKVHNYGPDAATNVQISDILPSGLTPLYYSVSYNGGISWTYMGAYSGVWNIANLPSGAEYWIGISTNVTQTGTKTNVATVTHLDQYDPTPATASAVLNVPAQADVQITETSNGPVNVGQTGTFTITLHNNGPDTAHNVVVTDILPSGFTAGTPSQGSFSGNTWIVGDIASGSEVTLTISGIITPAMAGTTITNTATETQDEYSSLSNQATASINVPAAASVVLHKEFRNQPWGNVITTANYHNTIWAMVEATNIGPNGTSVTIDDILTGLNWTGNYRVYLAGNPNDPTSWMLNDPANPFNGTSWSTYLGLLGGNTKWLAIECIINQTGSVSNFANVTSQSAYAYDGLSNATATLDVPRQANVYITTTPSKTNLTVGETLVITVKVGNYGPDTAQGVVASYVVPSGFEFMSVTADAGLNPVYDPATRTVTWNLGDVPVGDPYMYITLRAVSSGTFDNIARIISEITYDPNTDNKASSVIINVLQPVPKAHAVTIPLQHTGLPLAGLVLAVLAVFGGLVMPKREN